jgi:aspartate aminotransferase-like enzyme
MLVSEDVASHGVTAVLSQGDNVPRLIRWLQETRQILVAGGFGEYRERMFRVGHMGPGANLDAVHTLLDAVQAFRVADAERNAHNAIHMDE